MIVNAVGRYESMVRELWVMKNTAYGGGDRAKQLTEDMGTLWLSLTDAERDKMRELSARLYGGK